MRELDESIKEISEIRSMMERSSKVLSLSGLSGVSAGAIAVAGSMVAYWTLTRIPPEEALAYVVIDALLVLLLGIGSAALFSIRMARKRDLPVWTNTSKYMLMDLAVPLAAGGAFCLVLLSTHTYGMIAGTMLLFYGLALTSGSRYSVKELRYLGFTELLLGFLALFFPAAGLYIWTTGFGLMHIVYGLWMYIRYEK